MYRIFLYLIAFILLSGCGQKSSQLLTPIVQDQTDLSCSYFYFLWGTHAEFDEKYSEALEAYEKALICDPKAHHVKEKIPILMLKMGEFDKAAKWLAAAILEHPKNNTFKLFLANLYVQQEKIESAIKLYREVLESDPDNEAVHVRLGLLYSYKKEYDVAEQIFRKLLKTNEDAYFTRLSLARLLKQRKNYEAAIQEYEKVLTLNWSKELAYELGFLYVNRKQYENALRIYTTITDNDRFDERASLSRIQTLLDLEKYKDATNELYRVRHFSKKPERIDLILSKVLLRQKKLEMAKEILSHLIETSELTEPRYMLALLAYQEQQYKTSLNYLKEIQPKSEEFEEAVYLQTRIFRKQDKLEKAIEFLEKHIGDTESSSPLFYALLSSLYQEQGDKFGAIGVMEAATTVYPENHQLFFEYGLLLEKSGMYERALIKMERVLQLQPNHAEALNFIGYTWADRNIRLDEALDYILKANKLKPNNGFIVDSLGWVYFRLGKYDEAASYLKKSLTLQPDDPHIYDHLGDVYRALKKFEKALDVYKQAYEMFDSKKKKKGVEKKIKALESMS